jgi:ElaA protein
VSKTSVKAAETGGANGTDRADVFWQWSRFSELRPDGRDPGAWHLLGWNQGSAERLLVAYARVFEPGIRYTEGSIGRVATAREVRRTGLGRRLMAEALRRLETLAPGKQIKLAAQQRLEAFYAGFGFAVVSPPYEEDGIMHVDMVR